MATNLTWYSDANYQLPDYSTADAIQRSTLWTLKAYLRQQIVGATNGANGTAPAGAAWTCVGSSDGSGSYNMSGTDLWGATYNAAKLVYANAGTNHSWMVLQSPAGIATDGPYQLLMDCNTTSVGNVRFSLSKAGFTGGSATTAPTATDAAPYQTNPETMNGDTTTTSASYAHITRTATGGFYFTTTRIGGGFNGTFMSATALLNQNASDQWRLFGLFYTGANALRNINRISARAYNNTAVTNSTYMVTTAISNGGQVTDYAGLNAVTNAYPAYPLSLYTQSTGANGYRGQLPDLYQLGTGRNAGDVAPSSGTQEYVCTPLSLLPFNCLLTV